jgi:hypothetical protein
MKRTKSAQSVAPLPTPHLLEQFGNVIPAKHRITLEPILQSSCWLKILPIEFFWDARKSGQKNVSQLLRDLLSQVNHLKVV